MDVVERPVAPAVVDGVIATFVERFMVAKRRERARLKLGTLADRETALHEMWAWLDPRWTTALEGNTGFPQHLRARFGELAGVLVRPRDAVGVTIAEAACAVKDAGFFLADDGKIGLVFMEIGAPYLCVR